MQKPSKANGLVRGSFSEGEEIVGGSGGVDGVAFAHFLSTTLQAMCKSAVLVGLVTALTFSGCVELPMEGIERCFDLPDSVGTLSIRLDSNLTQVGRWKHPSDFKCGAQWVECYSYKNWPMYQDTSYMSPSVDSLFQFTLRYSYYSLEECDRQNEYLPTEEILASTLRGGQLENPRWNPIDHGLIVVHGIEWGYVYSSDSTALRNDVFQCFTNLSGRGIFMTWQRVATTPVTFDFGACARRQLETARFD